MKHDGSTGGRSSMRGKCQRIFFNAWNLHGLNNDSLSSLGQREPFPHGHEKG